MLSVRQLTNERTRESREHKRCTAERNSNFSRALQNPECIQNSIVAH